MNERGKIYRAEYASQIRDYSGLRYGKITPTDIDGFMDFGNEAFVFLELKHAGAELPRGQRLALSRLCDACRPSVPSIVFVAEHENTPPDEIDGGNARVVEIYHGGKWAPPRRALTLREAVDIFRERHLTSF
jgi:hypothetical protein